MNALTTERLVLRLFRANDIDELAGLLSNPDFMRFSLGVFSRDKAESFLQKILARQSEGLPTLLAVELKSQPHLLGYCGIHDHPEIDDLEIGYRLRPDYWNRGLITEAARAVRDHAFRDLKLLRVVSLIHPDNIPSRRVAEKNGMTLERQITFRGFPTNVFALSREKWQALRAA